MPNFRIMWFKSIHVKNFTQNHLVSTFSANLPDEVSEELLTLHDEALVQVKNYYETNKEILEAVRRREDMWKKMLEFEVDHLGLDGHSSKSVHRGLSFIIGFTLNSSAFAHARILSFCHLEQNARKWNVETFVRSQFWEMRCFIAMTVQDLQSKTSIRCSGAKMLYKNTAYVRCVYFL